MDREAAASLRYTGYVDDGGRPRQPTFGKTRRDILVSGGSSAASLPLYRAALGAAALRARAPLARRSSAPAWPDAMFEPPCAATRPRIAAVERARPDFRALLGREPRSR